MAKVFTFNPDDSLDVIDAVAPGIETRWRMTAEQAARHEAMFRAEMTVAQRTRLDQIKAREPGAS